MILHTSFILISNFLGSIGALTRVSDLSVCWLYKLCAAAADCVMADGWTTARNLWTCRYFFQFPLLSFLSCTLLVAQAKKIAHRPIDLLIPCCFGGAIDYSWHLYTGQHTNQSVFYKYRRLIGPSQLLNCITVVPLIIKQFHTNQPGHHQIGYAYIYKFRDDCPALLLLVSECTVDGNNGCI